MVMTRRPGSDNRMRSSRKADASALARPEPTTSATRSGSAPDSIRRAKRSRSTAVLPVPGPPVTSRGPDRCSRTRACRGSGTSSISLRMLLRPSDTPAVRACGSARWPPRATAATTPGPRRRGNRSGGATLPEGAAPEPAVDVGEGDLADDLAVLHHHGGEADAGELVHHLVQPVVEPRSEEHTSELQSHHDLVCRLLLEKK